MAWQLFANDRLDRQIDQSLKKTNPEASRFDRRHQITWDIIEGVIARDPSSETVFYRVLLKFLEGKAAGLLKSWGKSRHYADIPDLVNGFILERIFSRQTKFWEFFMNNRAVQNARGSDTVPFASAIHVPFLNYIRDQVMRDPYSKHTQGLDSWDLFDVTDPLDNPFTRLNRTQEERRLHKELMRLFNEFIRGHRDTSAVKAMGSLMRQILFEENRAPVTQLVKEFIQSDLTIQDYIESQGDNPITDLAKWVKKLHANIRNAISRFYAYAKKNIKPQFMSMAVKAYVRRVACDTLSDFQDIARFNRISKWMPPQAYAEYDYVPSYEQVKSQAYMQVDLAVSFAAVVYETLSYMRADGFDQQRISEEDFYDYADRAGFPMKVGRIPTNYLNYLIHKYRHLFHPALDLDHPEDFKAMKAFKQPAPFRNSIRLSKLAAGGSDKAVQDFVKQNISLLDMHDLKDAYIRAVQLKFQKDTGFFLAHLLNHKFVNGDLGFEVNDVMPYDEILSKFKAFQSTHTLSKQEMKEKANLSAKKFQIRRPGILGLTNKTYGQFAMREIVQILEYIANKKFRNTWSEVNDIIDKYALYDFPYSDVTIPELGNVRMSVRGQTVRVKTTPAIWTEFDRIYQLLSS